MKKRKFIFCVILSTFLITGGYCRKAIAYNIIEIVFCFINNLIIMKLSHYCDDIHEKVLASPITNDFETFFQSK